MKRDELLKKASDLGIDVDGRWSDQRLQSEIDKKQAENDTGNKRGQDDKADEPKVIHEPTRPDTTPQVAMEPKNMGPQPVTVPGETRNEQPPQPKGGDVPIRLKYDTWFKEDQRTKAGAIVKTDLETAKRLIADGKAERADPLPGERAA
jgi:hypothetical protein